MKQEFREEKYYGMYRAKVLENDETKLPEGDANAALIQWGRIKVRAYPMMASEDIHVEALPWAVPALPLKEGSGIGFGGFSVPRKDAMVWVFFEDGDPMCPVYFAEAPDGVHGLPAWRTTNYPNRKGFTLENGLILWIDEQLNEVYLEHPSKTFIKISIDGKVEVETALGDISLRALLGKISVKADFGDIDVEATAGLVTINGGTGVAINP